MVLLVLWMQRVIQQAMLPCTTSSVLFEQAEVIVCAATYAYHLTQAHAFIDGNKRIAAAVSELFLKMNGADLNATNREIVELFLGIADGHVTRDEVEQRCAQWVAPAAG